MEKKLNLKLNGARNICGILRGFDPFMNLVIDEAIETCKTGEKRNVGMVVSGCSPFAVVCGEGCAGVVRSN